MTTNRRHFYIALSRDLIVQLFLKMGYTIPVWFSMNIPKGSPYADLEFKKPVSGGMEYHVRADRLGDGFVADCHYEPSQSEKSVEHGRDFITGMLFNTSADYSRGRAQLLADLTAHLNRDLWDVMS